MRHPLLWLAGLFVIGLLTYWLMRPSRKAPPPPSPQMKADSSTPQTPPQSPPSESGGQPGQSPPQEKPPPTSPARRETAPKSPRLALESLFSLDHLAARSAAPCDIVRHTYYLLCYAEAHEQPRWTAYILEGSRLKEARVRRTQDFREDPRVPTHSASLSDYRRSGYDRGHLVPAGDFKWDSTGMSETFYLSNISPQLHEFNAGIWEAVERTVRAWAKNKGRLVVYTGPLLRADLRKIGNNVSVPDTFYKVIYALSGSEIRAAGFLVPHRSFPESAVPRFLLPVDLVEKVTGIDFFPALPDPAEERAESQIDRGFWSVPFTKR